MRILTVPNWSFGRNRLLLQQFQDELAGAPVRVHYCHADPDHNRTVTAFSGEGDDVRQALLRLCELALDTIDLNRHMGVHPRIGALDVCPFVSLDHRVAEALVLCEAVAQEIADRWHVPVFLYEKSERGRHEADLPTLRRGGFGSLLVRTLQPDFGPERAHPRLGVTVMGVRDFLIAMNVDLQTEDLRLAKQIASEIRTLRTEGDPRFLGVRALGFPLGSREVVQVSLNVTLPDLTPVDPIVEWVRRRAASAGVSVAGTELIGVIRSKDLPQATSLPIRPEQVVEAE